VFQTAKFSARAGISLPPYVEEGKRDPAIALHLARYGDADGALLLCDPADTTTVKQIESLRAGRNYPVEWARLIAIAQFVAELRLAGSDTQGATNLIQIHQQLQAVLDPKAAAGPLGSALLGGGHRALAAAGAAWQEGKKTGLAGDVAAAIANWGEVPVPSLPLGPGASQAAVAGAFSSAGKTRALTVITICCHCLCPRTNWKELRHSSTARTRLPNWSCFTCRAPAKPIRNHRTSDSGWSTWAFRVRKSRLHEVPCVEPLPAEAWFTTLR
jgi:hypothetical protein